MENTKKIMRRSGRHFGRSNLFLLALILFNCLSLDAQTRQSLGYLSQDGKSYRFGQTQHNNLDGNWDPASVYYYDFLVPQAGSFPYLSLSARGGDGGKRWIKDVFGKTVRTGQGGQGALVQGIFKIGSGANELKPGSTLRVIVGQCGHSGSNCWGCTGDNGAGGGGGTGILYLPAGANGNNPSDWKILAVAGGGGGGQANTSGTSANGRPAEISEDGFGVGTDHNFYAHNRHGGYGYNRNVGPAGGTDIDNGNGHTSVYPNALIGKGGFQPVNGIKLPIGGMGGDTVNYGGYGFGGGGGGCNTSFGNTGINPGGGGGGYSGGFAGGFAKSYSDNWIGGGGGGSYLNTAFVLPATGQKVKNGTTDNPANGFVDYQFFATIPVVSCGPGLEAHKSTQVQVLHTGDWSLMWQTDGNLVLYQAGVAKWASNTQNRASDLYFQSDGNLVIYQTGVGPVWASSTANNQHNGEGGRKLLLTAEGHLRIIDSDNKVIWQGR